VGLTAAWKLRRRWSDHAAASGGDVARRTLAARLQCRSAMRNTMLAALTLVAVGCAPPVNPNAKFDLVADDGQVTTNGRNFFTDGIPNPDVCTDFGGAHQCSGEQTQTYYPSWHATLIAGVVGTQLLAAPVSIDYVDRGLFHDVQICSGNVQITQQYLQEGGFTFTCNNNGSHVSFALKLAR
jgi:hypothetical protein